MSEAHMGSTRFLLLLVAWPIGATGQSAPAASTPAESTAERYCRIVNADIEPLIPKCLGMLTQTGLAASFPGEQRVLDGRAASAIQSACAHHKKPADRKSCAASWVDGLPAPASQAALEAFDAAEEARSAELRAELAAIEQRLAEAKAERELAASCKRRGYRVGHAQIGMSIKDNLSCGWGKPHDVNRTITAHRTTEQWVYGGGSYLYFDNGRLTTIQN